MTFSSASQVLLSSCEARRAIVCLKGWDFLLACTGHLGLVPFSDAPFVFLLLSSQESSSQGGK